MAQVFRPVPDWFSAEDQGGGVAVASLAGDGSQDLIALLVNHPGGKNRDVYRIGKAIDAEMAR